MLVNKSDGLSRPKIYRVKIFHHGKGCYSFSFRHTGDFRLNDYEELDFAVIDARLVRRK